MTVPSDAGMQRRRRLVPIIAGAVLAGAAAGLAAVYGIGAIGRNAGMEAACRPAQEIAGRLAPLARGEVAALAVAAAPKPVPALGFKDTQGRARTLAEWRGRLVLLNLWATWCVPCRREMPALDALEAKLGGPRFEVVAVNIDTRDPNKAREWLRDTGIAHLAYYADPSAKVFQELKLAGTAFGMPTTLLLDPHGCELGTLAGPAEWASQDALNLVGAALGS